MNYNDINKSFKKYKIKKKRETMAEICKPKDFKLQQQQLFLADLFKQKKNIRGLLVYHKIGAGKTCTAISIAENLKKKMKIMVLLPAALIGNFEDELLSKCGKNEYISEKDYNLLSKLNPKSKKYEEIQNKAKSKIYEYYEIYSYHKFQILMDQKRLKFRNTLLIIDEIQNMISEGGTFYKSLNSFINRADEKSKILLLSATPMFDKPVELALTMNLLKKNKIPIGNDFNTMFLKQVKTKDGISYDLKNKNLLKKHLHGLISYYRGASPVAFPKTNFNVVRCNMSDFQYKSYLTSLSTKNDYVKGSFRDVDILKLPNNFLLGPRMVSNVTFPNKSIGEKGFQSFKGSCISPKKIKTYSTKFYKINNKIRISKGPVFVYSNFKDVGGLKPFRKFLECQGYKDYKTYGPGKNRYAVWSGDEKHSTKEQIKKVYNNPNNHNGSMIKIMLGSPSIKEGVSLLRTEQVHILEPYWNMSRLLQIIGRAIRFCSHKDLPSDKRKVDVFLYLATYPKERTTDEHIWSLAKRKNVLINQFETVMKEMAIDCKLFYERNVYRNEKPIKCY